jgi:uncharacterized protein HemX
MSEPRSAPRTPAVAPRIPPPPKLQARRQRKSDVRALIWAIALVLGIGAGVAGYQFVPGVELAFDYWLALVMVSGRG